MSALRQAAPVRSENWTDYLSYLGNGARSINQSINQSIKVFLEWPKWHCHCKLQDTMYVTVIYTHKVAYWLLLVPKLVTLNDFERRNGRYFALY